MENLGIDFRLLIAQIINFGLFFIIIRRFIAKPFLKFLNQERQQQEEKQKLLEKVQKQEAELENKEKERQKTFHKELDKVLIQAKKDGERVKEEIIKRAKEEAEVIKNNGKKIIDQEKQALYKQVKEKVSELSFLIVNESLKEVLDEETKKSVTEKMLSKLSKDISLYEN